MAEKIHVLSVDDKAENRHLLEAMLIPNGYTVVSATNGIDALERLRKEPFDAIVSDLMMPKMDGFQLLHECKKDPALNKIPFIIYTATYTGKKDIEFGLSLGAVRYIIKPMESDVFLAMLKEVLNGISKGTIAEAIPEITCDAVYTAEHIKVLTEKMEKKVRALEEQREQYGLLADNVSDVIWLLDVVTERFIYVSPSVFALRGYTPEEVMAQPMSAAVTPASYRIIAEDLTDRIKHFEAGDEPLRIQRHDIDQPRKDGTIVPTEVVTTLLAGPDRRVTRILGVTRDITERKRVDKALRESEERYRNIVEDQTEFICRFLPDGTHIFVNAAYCRYFNKRQEEIIGHRFRPVIYPEDREIVAKHLASLTLEHPVGDIDQRIIIPDGSIRWQRWSDRAIFGENGRIVEYQSVGRDITEQKELEKEREYHALELRKISTSLATANKKLTLLSRITRHDINNQLTVILGYMDVLKSKQFDPTLLEYFQMVATAAKRISAIIRFTREYEKVGVTAPVWQDCRTFIARAAKDASLGKVKIKNEIPTGTEVFADLLIVKVCYNLMDNAVRHGGKITTIRFSVEESGDDHLIVCEDDGVGILAEDKERIFERGFGKNTGLGLALSREILGITDITIQETGEPGKGARFEMLVPKGMYRFIDTRGK